MKKIECDIRTYALIDSESVGMVFSYISSLEHFQYHVVKPSIKTLTNKLDELQASDDPSSVFLAGDIEALMGKTIEGYLLILQSMWERGLRQMLANCELRIFNGKSLNAIKIASWSGKPGNLQEHFLRLLGISASSFSSFNDLDFLQTIGNAIRHGDGNSAQRVYRLSPSLWPSILKSDQIIFSEAIRNNISTQKPVTPQFDKIEIPAVALEQMIKSVLWFWEDIENIRCNSFRRKSGSVVKKLTTWIADFDHRNLERVWSPG